MVYLSPAAEVQRRLWGTDPRAWADLAESHNRPLFEALLDATGVGAGVNAFQFAGDPVAALREAARVCRVGGVVAASLFAAPERSQSTVLHHAMAALSPPERAAEHAPYLLSAPGNLEAALVAAGLELVGDGEVACAWRYASMDDAVRGLLCSAGGARAAADAGADAVRAVLRETLAEFEDGATGRIVMHTTFRWVAGRVT